MQFAFCVGTTWSVAEKENRIEEMREIMDKIHKYELSRHVTESFSLFHDESNFEYDEVFSPNFTRG